MRSVLAVDIGGTKLASAVVEEGGGVRDRAVIETRADEGSEAVLERAVKLAEVVREKQGPAWQPSAIGVSTKGVTAEDGVMVSGMPGWSGVRVPSRLRERFPSLEVWTVNDVKAATLAELRWGALRGAANGLYVNLGTGIASGIVFDGQVVEGAHGAAGEIGYLIPSMAALEHSEELEVALGPGQELPALLEQEVGGGAIPARTKAALGTSLSMAELADRAKVDDRAASVLKGLFCQIAMWVVNVALVVDPERIVIGGGFIGSGGPLYVELRSVIARHMPFPPELAPAHFGADSALVGAGAWALERPEPVAALE